MFTTIMIMDGDLVRQEDSFPKAMLLQWYMPNVHHCILSKMTIYARNISYLIFSFKLKLLCIKRTKPTLTRQLALSPLPPTCTACTALTASTALTACTASTASTAVHCCHPILGPVCATVGNDGNDRTLVSSVFR